MAILSVEKWEQRVQDALTDLDLYLWVVPIDERGDVGVEGNEPTVAKGHPDYTAWLRSYMRVTKALTDCLGVEGMERVRLDPEYKDLERWCPLVRRYRTVRQIVARLGTVSTACPCSLSVDHVVMACWVAQDEVN